jgi:hypothetical protein
MKPIRLLSLSLLIVSMSAIGFVEVCRAGESLMISAWKRTWHAQYAPRTPLRSYYIFRSPNCGCWGAGTSGDGAFSVASGCETGTFERLGQIPNDMAIGAGAPVAGVSSR